MLLPDCLPQSKMKVTVTHINAGVQFSHYNRFYCFFANTLLPLQPLLYFRASSKNRAFYDKSF